MVDTIIVTDAVTDQDIEAELPTIELPEYVQAVLSVSAATSAANKCDCQCGCSGCHDPCSYTGRHIIHRCAKHTESCID